LRLSAGLVEVASQLLDQFSIAPVVQFALQGLVFDEKFGRLRLRAVLQLRELLLGLMARGLQVGFGHFELPLRVIILVLQPLDLLLA
jgi:hypothetical protein